MVDMFGGFMKGCGGGGSREIIVYSRTPPPTPPRSPPPRRKRRHSYTNDPHLDALLSSYNSSNSSLFVFLGFVNPKLGLCHQCGDIKKNMATDIYYVNKMEEEGRRTVLCHGCMLKRIETKEGEK